MQSNRWGVWGLVVMLLLAGCTGGGNAVSDAVAEGAESGDVAASEGSGASPDLTDPETALRDAESFTASWRYAGTDERGVRSEVRYEYAADLRTERSSTVTSSAVDGQSAATTSEQFVADGVTYVRSGSVDAPAYASYPGSTDVVSAAVGLSHARAYGTSDGMTNRGTERYDGVTVTRYELTEAQSQMMQAGSMMGGDSSGVTEITDFHYVVLVDEDGLSRYESWSFTGRTAEGTSVSGEWEYSLTGVGTTTVDDPDWLAAARASA